MPDPIDIFTRPHRPEAPPPALKTLTVRFPLPVFQRLQAMSEAADISLNAMSIQLVEWGIQSALNDLPPEISESIEAAFPDSQDDMEDL